MSTKIKRLLELDRAELRLLAAAWIGLAVSRVALSVTTFERVDRLIGAKLGKGRSDRPTPERIAWLVRAAANNHLCAMRCLPRSLTLRRLLNRRGFPAVLRIGVEPKREPELAAHAWVEIDGKQIGEPTDLLDRYRPLPPLAEAGSSSAP